MITFAGAIALALVSYFLPKYTSFTHTTSTAWERTTFYYDPADLTKWRVGLDAGAAVVAAFAIWLWIPKKRP